MGLYTLTEVLRDAKEKGYAVGAFNANNMEIVQAVIDAAEEEKAPVILQASQGALKYAGIELVVAMVKAKAERARVPIALHLDHGTSRTQVMQCIREGFTSVMFDGSAYTLEENIHLTREIVELSRSVGVSVEGELGRIGGTEDDITVDQREALFTDPREAKTFVKNTSVDALAVAIGTAHGPYKGEPALDFDRLRSIQKEVDMPLVLHGASGLSDESISNAVGMGVCKVNIDTDLRQVFTGTVREFLQNNPREYDPRKFLKPAREQTKNKVQEKIRVFGSSNRIARNLTMV